MTEQERTEMLRVAALENAIGSGKIEGLEYSPAMLELLERDSRGELTKTEFMREAVALAKANG